MCVRLIIRCENFLNKIQENKRDVKLFIAFCYKIGQCFPNDRSQNKFAESHKYFCTCFDRILLATQMQVDYLRNDLDDSGWEMLCVDTLKKRK